MMLHQGECPCGRMTYKGRCINCNWPTGECLRESRSCRKNAEENPTNPMSDKCCQCGLRRCYYVTEEYYDNCCVCRRTRDLCSTCDSIVAKRIVHRPLSIENPKFVGLRTSVEGRVKSGQIGAGTFYFRPPILREPERIRDRLPFSKFSLQEKWKFRPERFKKNILNFKRPYYVDNVVNKYPIPSIFLFKKWFPEYERRQRRPSDGPRWRRRPGLRMISLMSYYIKPKQDEDSLIDNIVAWEAVRRGYDAIVYGDFEIQDLRGLSIEECKEKLQYVRQKYDLIRK